MLRNFRRRNGVFQNLCKTFLIRNAALVPQEEDRHDVLSSWARTVVVASGKG
jgi:hypothetical protein